MIVVDIETSGDLFPEKNAFWQIGAVDTNNPENFFLEEARVDDSDCIEKIALDISGRSEDDLRNKNKQSEKEMLEKFFAWCEKTKIKNFACYSTPFDYGFLWAKAKKYGIPFNVSKKTIDLFAVALLKMKQVKGSIDISDNQIDLSLKKTIDFCGMKDNRRSVNQEGVINEGVPHDALLDAKLTAECLHRIMYGRNLLKEFNKSQIPDYLKAKEAAE